MRDAHTDPTLKNFCILLESIFSGYVPLVSQSPYPIIVYSETNYTVGPILVAFGQICNFHYPNLVTFCLSIYLINPLNRSS